MADTEVFQRREPKSKRLVHDMWSKLFHNKELFLSLKPGNRFSGLTHGLHFNQRTWSEYTIQQEGRTSPREVELCGMLQNQASTTFLPTSRVDVSEEEAVSILEDSSYLLNTNLTFFNYLLVSCVANKSSTYFQLLSFQMEINFFSFSSGPGKAGRCLWMNGLGYCPSCLA